MCDDPCEQSVSGVSGSVAKRLARFAERFDAKFAELLASPAGVPDRLAEAVRYAALGPGKRIRPYLVVRCCTLAGGREEDAWAPAAAIEAVHAFSLVHDDLPAMDDDDLRRGRPTCHRQFDEAMAILAGDALLALAFELIATGGGDPGIVVGMIRDLSVGTGGAGMIGGQVADIEGASQPPELASTDYIHERKTARLIETACRLGASAAGAEGEIVAKLAGFGRWLGRAFQIADDLLDLTSTAEAMGKRVGKDGPRGKQTYPRCVGIEASRAAADDFAARAVTQLDGFDLEADDLRAFVRFVVDRNY